MRFNVGIHSTNTAPNATDVTALAFEIHENGLTAIGLAHAPFDIVVQNFDPSRDIFYRTPEPLTPDELAEEIEIHVPQSLRQRIKNRIVSGTMGSFVLMQNTSSATPVIPPLTALEKILKGAGNVNFAILQADNNGILFVRNAGNEIHADASTRSLKEFLTLGHDERERDFPDFHASEILLSGNDLGGSQSLDLTLVTGSRRIAIPDFTSICHFTPETATLVETNPSLYALVVGAAAVYADILQESKLNQK